MPRKHLSPEQAIRDKRQQAIYRAKPGNRERARVKSATYRLKHKDRLKEARKIYRSKPDVILRRAKCAPGVVAEIPTRPRPDGCEICGGTSPNGTQLHFDHCHETGIFRGWLCNRCNMTLGMVKHDPTILIKMVDYLTRVHKRSLAGAVIVNPRG
jgi:hypothetical protein